MTACLECAALKEDAHISALELWDGVDNKCNGIIDCQSID